INAEIGRRTVFAMPGVDLGLQLATLCEQRLVLRSEFMRNGRKTRPESVRYHARSWKRLGFHELLKRLCDFQTVNFDILRHLDSSDAAGRQMITAAFTMTGTRGQSQVCET